MRDDAAIEGANSRSTVQYRFAPEFREMRGSPIREIGRLSSDPAFVSLAGGYPVPALFDVSGIRQAMQETLSCHASESLQYGSTEGDQILRQVLARLCEARGLIASEDEILVTSGSQQALDLLIRVTITPGDMVVVSARTYPGAIHAFRLAGATIVSADEDENGILPESVEAVIAGLLRRPKMIYVGATFANPTGTTLPDDRRLKLAKIAESEGVLLVEDDAYSELAFGDRQNMSAPLRQFGRVNGAGEWCVYISTVSKIVAPALRIGWIVGPIEVVRRCVMAKQVGDMCTSPFAQQVVQRYLSSARFRQNLQQIRSVYEHRSAVMVRSVRESFGDAATFVEPRGGMFVFLRFTSTLDSRMLYNAAVAEKVLIVPGNACSAMEERNSDVRLSFAIDDVRVIKEGVKRLYCAFRKLM